MFGGPELVQDILSKWWILLIRGLVAVLFGIIAFAMPGLTLITLVWIIGAYLVWDGIFAFLMMFAAAHERMRWWPFLVQGIAGVAAGVFTFAYPGITALFLLYVIAGWALIMGVFQVLAAIRLRAVVEGEWMLALSGILSVLFGILLFVRPGDGALGLLWVIASYALVFGAIQIVLAFKIRGWHQRFMARGAPA